MPTNGQLEKLQQAVQPVRPVTTVLCVSGEEEENNQLMCGVWPYTEDEWHPDCFWSFLYSLGPCMSPNHGASANEKLHSKVYISCRQPITKLQDWHCDSLSLDAADRITKICQRKLKRRFTCVAIFSAVVSLLMKPVISLFLVILSLPISSIKLFELAHHCEKNDSFYELSNFIDIFCVTGIPEHVKSSGVWAGSIMLQWSSSSGAGGSFLGSITGGDTSFDVTESSCLLSGPWLQLESRYSLHSLHNLSCKNSKL